MRTPAIWALATAGCFSPSPPTGARCAPGDRCPPGQVCDLVSQTCELETSTPDGGVVPLDCDDWTYDPELIDPCAIELPGSPLVVDRPLVLDTDTGSLGADGDAVPLASGEVTLAGRVFEAAILSTARLEIRPGASLSLAGGRPLVIVSWSDAVIAGRLAADAIGAVPGPGADRGGCTFGPNEMSGDGGGGGGGGIGGPGGSGGGTDVMSPNANGGEPLGLGFYGGCSGQGAGGAVGESSGGGGGGGALAVVALDAIAAGGQISASGGGGGAGSDMVLGGGGGGAGGLVALVGSSIAIGGSVTANSGGGGGGGDGNSIGPGPVDGQDGGPGLIPALGGAGAQPDGGDGGAGSAGENRDGAPGAPGAGNQAGGGGGGGGAGMVLLSGQSPPDITGVVSPFP